MKEEKTIIINLRLSRGVVMALVGVLIMATLFVSFSLTRENAMASTGKTSLTQSSGMRQFYLTDSGTYYGSIAKTACATGYHMASLWEITDPSNLKYNASLGYQQTDSGEGPPADEVYVFGWVRTGYVGDTSTTVGRANCNNWTSHGFSQYGTTASLPSQWASGLQDIGVWQLSYDECDDWNRVWCIED
jgi:hypothetical protein